MLTTLDTYFPYLFRFYSKHWIGRHQDDSPWSTQSFGKSWGLMRMRKLGKKLMEKMMNLQGLLIRFNTFWNNLPILDYRCNCRKWLSELEDITKKSADKKVLSTKAKLTKMLSKRGSKRRVITRAMLTSRIGYPTWLSTRKGKNY